MKKIWLMQSPRFVARIMRPGAELMRRCLQEGVRELNRDEDQSHAGEAQPRTRTAQQADEQQRVNQQTERERAYLCTKRPPAVINPQNVIDVMQQSEKNRDEDQQFAARPRRRGGIHILAGNLAYA